MRVPEAGPAKSMVTVTHPKTGETMKVPIKIALNGWTSADFHSYLAKIIIEDVVGYSTTMAEFGSTSLVPANLGISDFEPMGKDENGVDSGIGGRNKIHLVCLAHVFLGLVRTVVNPLDGSQHSESRSESGSVNELAEPAGPEAWVPAYTSISLNPPQEVATV